MSDFHAEAPAMIRARQRLLTETRLGRFISGAACAAMLIASAPAPLFAQGPPPPGQPYPGQPYPGQPPEGQPPQGQQEQGYAAEQLDALLAPIALYPDQLLTQVLMASAFPDQVQAAQQWCSNPANAQLRGDQLSAALTPIQWDPSVKSLIPFPQVLAMMTQQPDWMQQLGYAMSVQQQDVMASVQRLRQQAQISGSLKTTSQQVVRTEVVEGQSAVVIEPAQPDVVYVPSYNPVTVYGAWPYPSYPPYYLPPPVGYDYGAALVGGLAFGAAVAVGVGIWGGLYGWARPNWGGGNVFINVNNYNRWSPYRPWHGGGGAWHPYRPLGRPGWGYRPPGAAYHPPGGYRFNANNQFRAAPVHYGRPVGAAYRGPVNGANGYRGAPGVNGRAGMPETRPAFHAPTNVNPARVPGERPGNLNTSRPGTAGATRPGNVNTTRPAARTPGTSEAHRSQAATTPHRSQPAHRSQAAARPSEGPRPGAGGGGYHPPAGGGYHPPAGGGYHPPAGGGFHPQAAARPAAPARPAGGGGHPGGGGEHRH